MGQNSTDAKLADTLVSRVNAILRITGMPGHVSDRTRKEQISSVIDKVRVAIARRDSRALEATLRSLDLLSLELCEE
jgi:hypothetical protein